MPFSDASSFFFLFFFPYITLVNVCLYRDGVSEGQFYQVLLYELDAIRKVVISSLFLLSRIGLYNW